ncbi:hypothetical protein BCEN4_740051 [Burkholderia cenocepacia]|nr:hypothetical protein BCEN4_740051 [Burkholderia cenocepacia]
MYLFFGLVFWVLLLPLTFTIYVWLWYMRSYIVVQLFNQSQIASSSGIQVFLFCVYVFVVIIFAVSSVHIKSPCFIPFLYQNKSRMQATK